MAVTVDADVIGYGTITVVYTFTAGSGIIFTITGISTDLSCTAFTFINTTVVAFTTYADAVFTTVFINSAVKGWISGSAVFTKSITTYLSASTII